MLSDTACRTIKPTDKNQKLFDGGGLFLLVTKAGAKYWRMKYRINGKEKLLTIGVYPEISLKEARLKKEDARKLLAENIDPSEHKQLSKLIIDENSFEFVAREWHSGYKHNWTEDHGQRILIRLEKDIFPYIGKRPTNEIKAPELLATLRRIESRGALETAHRAMGNCGQVFRYAVATGRAERDPTGDLKGALP
jgi:hypothetical protein